MQHDDALIVAERWLSEGRTVALATVVDTWGSAPRATGSHLVIDGNGNFEGSVSGGCVEGAVVVEAQDSLASGRSRMLDFGVADETAWEVGLSCGGNIRVFVQPADGDLLSQLNDARAKREAVCVVTDLDNGTARLVRQGDGALDDRFRSGKSGIAEDGSFVRAYLPAPRLVVIGAVHISQALYPMAQTAGFDVSIIDPRTAFATPERFAGVGLHADWPSDVLAQHPLDTWTAVAAVTHDPKIDDDALVAALKAECFYVGALGSRKTNAKRQERLKARGVSEAALGRIAAPIGLDIGAAGPAEIAVAVLAQVIQVLRKGTS